VSVVSSALELARDLVSVLEGEERSLGAELCAQLATYSKAGTLSDEEVLAFRRSVNRLVELLARRQARAMPLAALGRAALAELSGDVREARRLVDEFETKLALLGLV
jgi:hypothetical protein